ncbi:PEGA domain-containing protein [Kribbella sandramycini]|uniref:PEGA domain-containing protein n=1 Tax=Kribbella sandramycini TaxID=60450 RepID=A0A7Y4KZL3_9ACTN|nr:PEGA domain-containing protein [Kribbella sandramycini]MBB6565333.1 hypothetical protein [Kribbella sandramycini]NOL41602.1 PEGA domain-containing protein [Kribbella sandramycini]
MEDEGRQPLLLGAIALAVAIVVIGGFLILRGGSEAKLTVTSIPNDLTLTLDGQQVAASGELKVKKGTHTLTGERRGFQTYSTTFSADGDELAIKMYLYANSAEGREWTKNNPEQELELEREAGRQYDQTQQRLVAKYPIIQSLPFIGVGFKADYTSSKTDPNNPEAISVTILTYAPDAKEKALEWMQQNGWDPNTLDIVYSTVK